jgi:FAD/FMN-containing dehydrogenase
MSSATLPAKDIEDLGEEFRGELVLPGDDSYDEHRRVWNGMIDRRPALIARCHAMSDVIAVVNFARQRSLLLAVRGGGIGWLQRQWGLACDNLLAVELVTAAGEVVTASEAENPELFWCLRGGGGNFGVVTSFEFRLHLVSSVVGGLVLFEGSRTADVMRFYRDYVRDCPDELTTWLSAITAPPADFVPEDLEGKAALAVLACHCGDPSDAELAIRPLRELGPSVDLIESMPYPDLQCMSDEDMPWGVRCYLKAGYTFELTDALIDAIVERVAAVPSDLSTLDIHHMGGAVARVADDATAFGDRRSAFCFNIVGV